MRLENFQKTMVRPFFQGTRETLILIPKKNGKSSLLAALALYHLTHTLDANIAVVAASRDQAMILFEQAMGFVNRTPSLHRQVKVLHGIREIRRRDPDDPDDPKRFRGKIKVYPAEAATVDGWLGDLALVDELHRHRSLDLYGVLRDGLGPRGGRMVTISTAGDSHDSPLGLLRARAYEHDIKYRGAHRWVRTEGFAMHEWALDPGDDRADLRIVKRANPASWQTITALRERRDSPSMTPGQWARFCCGIWGLGIEPAFERELWDSLAEPELEIEPGRRVTLGFDGARRRDSTVLVACDVESGHQVVAGAWERPAQAGDEWEVPEDEVDQVVEDAFERWQVWRLYGDPPYWETALDRWAGHYGRERVVRWWTNRLKATAFALRAWQTDMRPGAMSHDGDELLARHIANAVKHRTRMRDADGEELWVIRKDSRDSPRKIDAAMAAVLAWTARRDAIRAGGGPEYAVAQW